MGRIGPKDGADYVGGNYATVLNFTSTLPNVLENAQNLDILIFLDMANLWGVDYDDSLDDGSKLRSSTGIGVDWFTPIGPLNFSISETLSKSDSDVTSHLDLIWVQHFNVCIEIFLIFFIINTSAS